MPYSVPRCAYSEAEDCSGRICEANWIQVPKGIPEKEACSRGGTEGGDAAPPVLVICRGYGSEIDLAAPVGFYYIAHRIINTTKTPITTIGRVLLSSAMGINKYHESAGEWVFECYCAPHSTGSPSRDAHSAHIATRRASSAHRPANSLMRSANLDSQAASSVPLEMSA